MIYIVLFSLSIAVISVGYSFYNLKRNKETQQKMDQMRNMIRLIQPTRGLERNLDQLLEFMSRAMDVSVYAFYIYDEKNIQYTIKAVRHRADDFGKVAPSYSGLAPFKKETYMPGMSIPSGSLNEGLSLVYEGEVPLLHLPIQDRIGIIRMGPICQIKRKERVFLKEFSEQIQPIVHELIRTEQLKNQVDVVVSSSKALQNISSLAVNVEQTLEFIIGAYANSLDSSIGIYLKQNGEHYDIPIIIGADSDVRKALKEDQGFHLFLHRLMEENEIVHLKRGQRAFYSIPDYIAALGLKKLSVIGLCNQACLAFLYCGSIHEDEDLSSIKLIAEDMSKMLHTQTSLQGLSRNYIHMLKQIARMVDNVNPHTVGSSDLMSRYSMIIARELGLEEQEIRDIGLAAYLSNIGVLGLSKQLFHKEGKYTEVEYEMMKLHSEVGAMIIKITTGNEKIASYIHYHHERIDGNGYPAGLRDQEIPLGAKIIAVVQTFLAKVNGRVQRDPLRFNQAIRTLEAASGSQLDARVVQALVQWFSRKQQEPAVQGRSLGFCWEMCCTPSAICSRCPAYKRVDVNCWELEENNCKAHGKSCETCFVYTEFQTRSQMKKGT